MYKQIEILEKAILEFSNNLFNVLISKKSLILKKVFKIITYTI